MKKIWLTFVMALLSVVIFQPLDKVHAMTTVSSAKEINVNTEYTGKLPNYYTNHYYKFTLAEAGNVVVQVNNVSGAKWSGKIINASGTVLTTIYTDSSSYALGSSSVEIGLPKGTFYFQLEDYSSSANKNYKFKLNYTKGNVYEQEDNDSFAKANTISPNVQYRGAINDSYDSDFYKVTLPKDGNVQLNIKNTSGKRWHVAVYDSSNKVHSSFYTDYSELATGYSVIHLNLPAGTYYIEIENSSSSVNEPYLFKVAYTQSDYFEKEFNDTFTTATTIPLNKDFSGTIQSNKDQDFYKFSLTKPGKIDLTFANKEGYRWYVQVMDASGNEFESFYTDYSSTLKPTNTYTIGLPKGTFYIKVQDSYSTWNIPYKFKVGYTATSGNFEQEFNNSTTTATAITMNKAMSGVINDSYYTDVDYYKFTVPAKGNVNFKYTQKYNQRWYYEIIDANGNEVNYFYTDYSQTAKSTGTFTSNLAKGTYYVRVANSYNTVRVPYQFTISRPTAAPAVKNITATNNLAGKNDTVVVKGLVKGDVVKVYNASSKQIATATSKGASATLSIKQLGVKASKVYVTVTKSGQTESPKTAVTFKGEVSAALKAASVKVVNNRAGKADTVTVSGLTKGDIVKVYSAATKGKLLATSKAATSTKSIISITQIGKTAGKVYVTVTKSGQTESSRTAISYTKEK